MEECVAGAAGGGVNERVDDWVGGRPGRAARGQIFLGWVAARASQHLTGLLAWWLKRAGGGQAAGGLADWLRWRVGGLVSQRITGLDGSGELPEWAN